MKSNYKLRKQEKTFCSDCNLPVHKISNDNEVTGTPSFYICFNCKKVTQVGVGEVDLEKE